MQLQDLAGELVQASYAQSTLFTYTKCWKKFLAFLLYHGFTSALPAPPEHIALFVASLFNEGKSLSTIRTNLSAISCHLKFKNLPDNSKHFIVIRMLKGIKNVEKKKPSLLPITFPILAKLINTLSLYTHDVFLRTLLKSMFLLCYHACLRVGELTHSNNKEHALKIENIVIHEAGLSNNITITLESFKHSKSPAVFVLMPSQDRHLCPVGSLLDYLKLRSASPGVLYRDIRNRPISRYFFVKHLKSCLEFLNLDTKLYNSHSFRIGRASDLAVQGTPESVIRQTGRWNSDAFLKYVRFELFRLPQS